MLHIILYTIMQHVTVYSTARSRVLIVVLLDICVLCDVVLCVAGWVVSDVRNCSPTDTASCHTRLGSLNIKYWPTYYSVWIQDMIYCSSMLF